MFTCPACEQTINPASEICPYCGADLVPAPRARRGKTQRKGLLLTLAGALVLAGGIWAMLWYALPHPDLPPRAVAEQDVTSQLRQMDAILNDYLRRQGTYPNSVDQVGSQASSAYSRARLEGYVLIYQPGEPGSDGDIHRFDVVAQPEFYGYRHFYLDQTGVIRSTSEGRTATSNDPPIY